MIISWIIYVVFFSKSIKYVRGYVKYYNFNFELLY